MTGQRLAIAGAEVFTALGSDLDTTWQNMIQGRSGLRPLEDRFAPAGYAQVAAWFTDEDLELVGGRKGSDPCLARRLAAHVGGAARERATQTVTAKHEWGLVLSSAKGDMDRFEAAIAGNGKPRHYQIHALAREVASDLGLVGPVMAVSHACASGSLAIAQAARLLVTGAAPAVLVIGVDTLSSFVLQGFCALRALSEGPCRPFDGDRDGMSLGEAAGALVLAPEGALTDSPYGWLMGWGVANDAHHMTGPSRTGEGLQRAMRGALAMSGMPPETIGYINAHGTGTVFNDEMECQAIAAVFGPQTPPTVSYKGALGHSLGAAGVVEAALTLQALQAGETPPNLGCSQMGVSLPLEVCTTRHVLDNNKAALSLKSGFGGINAALCIKKEERA